MLKDAYPYYLANEAVFANQDLDVTDKYSGDVATRVAMADAATIDQAIEAADKASAAMAALAARTCSGTLSDTQAFRFEARKRCFSSSVMPERSCTFFLQRLQVSAASSAVISPL
mgnify:CR=1 FL=1